MDVREWAFSDGPFACRQTVGAVLAFLDLRQRRYGMDIWSGQQWSDAILDRTGRSCQ